METSLQTTNRLKLLLKHGLMDRRENSFFLRNKQLCRKVAKVHWCCRKLYWKMPLCLKVCGFLHTSCKTFLTPLVCRAEMKCWQWVTRHTRDIVQQGQADVTCRHGPHGPHLDTETESQAECLALFCNKPTHSSALSPITHGSSSSSPSSLSPLASSLTRSVFHSELKTWLFSKSFPPQTFPFPTALITRILGPSNDFTLLNGWICLHSVLN